MMIGETRTPPTPRVHTHRKTPRSLVFRTVSGTGPKSPVSGRCRSRFVSGGSCRPRWEGGGCLGGSCVAVIIILISLDGNEENPIERDFLVISLRSSGGTRGEAKEYPPAKFPNVLDDRYAVFSGIQQKTGGGELFAHHHRHPSRQNHASCYSKVRNQLY